MGSGLTLSNVSALRKNSIGIIVSTLAALIAAFGFANFGLETLGFSQTTADNAAGSQPIWVGGLGPATADYRTPASALTSASYLLPAEKTASAAQSPEPACPNEASCAVKPEKTSRPPRKPQQHQAAANPAPVPAKRQIIGSAQEPKAADAAPQDPKPQAEAPKNTGWLDWSKIGDHLPKTDTLLKPFNVVSDAVSGLMKRF
jgi:hypothetical protein